MTVYLNVNGAEMGRAELGPNHDVIVCSIRVSHVGFVAKTFYYPDLSRVAVTSLAGTEECMPS